MQHPLVSPASYMLGQMPLVLVTGLITTVGLVFFCFVIYKRMIPLLGSAPDDRLNQFSLRAFLVLKYWLGQKKHPRYPDAGIIHIALFSGFLILSINTFSMAVIGFDHNFVFPGFAGKTGEIYRAIKDYSATILIAACMAAIIRRAFFLEERYRVPPRFGKARTWEAFIILGLIMTLLISEALFEASHISAAIQKNMAGSTPPPLTLTSITLFLLKGTRTDYLQAIHVISYLVHDGAFFFFLCYLPFSKHFHVITSIFNVFFKRTRTGNIKPVRYDVKESEVGDLESIGVKRIEDFTWKGILDFYSCVDCGRCSDNCPAAKAGSPLSPRFISIKARKFIYGNNPVLGKPQKGGLLMEEIYEEPEIWACTTCGACEEECPVCIEYIDKIVDLRRGLVDEGMVPQSLQKPLKSLEKRGNPFGKPEKKRSEWAYQENFQDRCQVLSAEKKEKFETLLFVDSMGSYDDRMVETTRAAAMILSHAGENFGILGKQEKDSGNEVRRFGEEMLFLDLKTHNTEMINRSGARQIVTADPHAFNVLKNEYENIPPVHHITTFIMEKIRSGKIKPSPCKYLDRIFTYHDPCYLGRHNQLYIDPRELLDSLPGLRRVEMKQSKDRSLCCGGGGLMLFYEPEADMRIGIERVRMAREAGADTIVTACPFCFANLQDALKVSGLDMEMSIMDICEIVAEHLR